MSEQRDYYNTNDEQGDVLRDSRSNARHQQDVVLAHYRAHPGRNIAPHQVPMPAGTPLTSVRRAITNLTEAGLLEKTDEMVPGTYGKQVHTWRLRQLVPFASLPPLPPTTEPALF